MKAIDYVRKFYPEAQKIELETGISAVAMISQSAGESGWKPGPGISWPWAIVLLQSWKMPIWWW